MANLEFCSNCVEYLEILLKITSDFSPFRVTNSNSWLLKSAHWHKLAQYLSDQREEWHGEEWYSMRQRSMNGRTANPENPLLDHRMSYLSMILKSCGTEEFAEFTVKLNCADAAIDIVSDLDRLGDHTVLFNSRMALIRQIGNLSQDLKGTFTDVAESINEKYTSLASEMQDETFQHTFFKHALWDDLIKILIVAYGHFPEKNGESAKNISNDNILKQFGVLSCDTNEMCRSPYIKSKDVKRALDLHKRLGGLWSQIGETEQVTDPKIIEDKKLVARIIERDTQLITSTINAEDVLQTLGTLQVIATCANQQMTDGEDIQKLLPIVYQG